MVWDTRTVVLVATGLASNQPVLLLYCQEAVPVTGWSPNEALAGMTTGVSTCLVSPAVRLNKRPEVTSRVPLGQKSDMNEIWVNLIVNWLVFVKLLTRTIAPPANGTPV